MKRESDLRGVAMQEVPVEGHTDLTPARLHARYACGALAHGSRLTAIRHGLCAIAQARGDRECWRAFRYVLTARRPVFYSR
jgi:hypothetical protein